MRMENQKTVDNFVQELNKSLDLLNSLNEAVKTYVQNKMLGKALEEADLLLDGKIIVSCITKEMMEEYGAVLKDLEGIVSQLRVTKGVEVAIFLYQTGEEEYKVSLRASGDVDVSKVAEAFDGGGHKKAAGVSIKGNAK